MFYIIYTQICNNYNIRVSTRVCGEYPHQWCQTKIKLGGGTIYSMIPKTYKRSTVKKGRAPILAPCIIS